MNKEKLYRLMDILDEIKSIEDFISKHESQSTENSALVIEQYKSRKEQLLTYFINEINASSEYKSSRLSMIKLLMERFYPEKGEEKKKIFLQDKNLNSLAEAILA